uniref:Uncharacterized protein n=1 Tax=Avena sativa TaxID=4498 RepID=A0ACD5TYL5_AVESA
MANYHQPILLFVLIIIANTIGGGGCFTSIEEQGNSVLPWPFKIHSEFSATSENLTLSQNNVLYYFSSHVLLPGSGNAFYGAEATFDVYNFNLQPGQISMASIWIIDRASLNGIQAGWHSGHRKGCTNMLCPGFHKTSSSISPVDVIRSDSHVHGKKLYMRLRVFKEKSSGDWHVHLYGAKGDSRPVGYFPKSLVPGLIDKNVEISFGGYVSHEKQQPSPPMGSGYVQASGYAASFTSLKLIDIDGNDHIVDKDLGSYVDEKCCYTPSHIDPTARFFYGGPGCVDSLCNVPHM